MTNSPYLLLVETSVIIDTDPHTWQAIAKLGECLLPEVVALEIKNIANGKAEGNEAVAKQFQNLAGLKWQITDLTAKHADLVVRTTQNLSRKAKLMIKVAQSAVGVANAYPQKCVVLISDPVSGVSCKGQSPKSNLVYPAYVANIDQIKQGRINFPIFCQ